jgi:hypothetical protein
VTPRLRRQFAADGVEADARGAAAEEARAVAAPGAAAWAFCGAGREHLRDPINMGNACMGMSSSRLFAAQAPFGSATRLLEATTLVAQGFLAGASAPGARSLRPRRSPPFSRNMLLLS